LRDEQQIKRSNTSTGVAGVQEESRMSEIDEVTV
jgi:hypothetical protein